MSTPFSEKWHTKICSHPFFWLLIPSTETFSTAQATYRYEVEGGSKRSIKKTAE
jgi:hypothetical protein